MMHFWIFMLIFCTLSSGCSKQTSPTEPEPQGIYGNWNWVKSVGGIAGVTITPASAGYTERLMLKSDNNRESYRNDTLVATTQFTIRWEKSPFSPDSVDVIHYADTIRFMDQIISVICSDTLGLFDLCYDCFGHTYTRTR